MEYSIQQLENSINAFKSSSNAKYYADQIKHLAYTISEGNKLTTSQIDKLIDIINQINSDQALKWIVYDGLRQKLWQCVYRGREEIASSFYVTHDKDTKQIDGIDFRKSIEKQKLKEGTILFQWCRTIQTKDGMVIYEPNTKLVTVGEYFSWSKVPQEQLGLNPYQDVYDPSGKYVITTNRVCCRFTLPFDVECLVSTAKGTFDNWSVYTRDSSGQKTGAYERFGVGGKQQIFIPFKKGEEGKEQRIQLAMNAQFV